MLKGRLSDSKEMLRNVCCGFTYCGWPIILHVPAIMYYYVFVEQSLCSLCVYNSRVTSIADRLNCGFALIHKERKKANEVR